MSHKNTEIFVSTVMKMGIHILCQLVGKLSLKIKNVMYEAYVFNHH